MPTRDERGTVGRARPPLHPLTRSAVLDILAALGPQLLAASSAADGPDPEQARAHLAAAARLLSPFAA